MTEYREHLLGTFFESRARYQEVVQQEISKNQQGEILWPVYGSSYVDYQEIFNDVLDKPIIELLQDRQNMFHQVYTLDACGDGSFLRSVGFLNGGTAITAADLRSESEKAYDQSHNINIVASHILSGKTFRTVGSLIGTLPGFDMIVCCPLAAWYDIAGYPLANANLERLLIDKLWGLLHPQGGTLLFEYAHYCDRSLEFWIDILKQTPGIEVTSPDSLSATLKLVRTDHSLQHLPKIPSDTLMLKQDLTYYYKGLLTPEELQSIASVKNMLF